MVQILRPISRANLRQLLRKLAGTDSDFCSLCIDHFPDAAGQFTQGMTYDDKMNQLLSRHDPEEILVIIERSPIWHVRLEKSLSQSVDNQTIRSQSPGSRAQVPPPRSAYDPEWYLSRPDEETRAIGALRYPGAAVLFQAPELFGKTWLMEHILHQIAERGRIVNLNLRAFASEEVKASFGLFLREFARQILDETSHHPASEKAALLEDAWSYSNNPIDSLNRLMEREILTSFRPERWLILCIDGADGLGRRPYLGDFFALLRAWMEEATRPPWSALRLLMSLSTSPALLIDNVHQSAFYVAEKIELGDFDGKQLVELSAKHHVAWTEADLAPLIALIGGHPYLVRLALYEASLFGRSISELIDPRSRVFREWLKHCDRILRQDAMLYGQFQRVVGDPTASLDLDAAERLRRAGLIIEDDESGGYHARYPLYHRLVRR